MQQFPKEAAEVGKSRAKVIRQQIWEQLRPIAKPDSRYHFDFTNVITDFQGSAQAVQRLVSQPLYRDARLYICNAVRGRLHRADET